MDTATVSQTEKTAKTARPMSEEHRKKLSEAMRGNSNARKTEAIKAAVVVKKVQGETNTQIAEDLGINRDTVRKILDAAEIDERVKEGRSRCIELIPKAINAVESDLDKHNGRTGLGLLNGVKVLNPGQTVLTQFNLQANTWVQMRATREAERLGLQELPPTIETSAIVPTSPESESK